MSKDSYPVRWAGRQAVVVLPEHIGHANAGQVSEELPSVTNRIVRHALSLSGHHHLISIYLLGHWVDSLIPDGLREARPGHGTAFAQATMAPASRNGGTAGRGTQGWAPASVTSVLRSRFRARCGRREEAGGRRAWHG